MKHCPKCNELNGDESTICFKCKTQFPGSGRSDNYKKICQKCGLTFGSSAVICSSCGAGLSVVSSSYSNGGRSSSSKSSGESNVWLYIVSIIIPFLGIVLGCIKIAKDEDDLGKSLIITGIVSNVIGVIISAIYFR